MSNKEYEVDICETSIKTVTVKARSEQEAHDKAHHGWRKDDYPLGADCISDVHITVIARQKERSYGR